MNIKTTGNPATRQAIYNNLKRWLKTCDYIKTSWQDCNNLYMSDMQDYTADDLYVVKDKVMNLPTGHTFSIEGWHPDYECAQYYQIYEVIGLE